MSDIRIYLAEGTWVVRANGAVIGESRNVLEMIQSDLPFVIYFPRSDIAMAVLEPSDQQIDCPHRGKGSYFHISTPEAQIDDGAYSFHSPSDAAAAIKDYIAFDAGKVTVERV